MELTDFEKIANLVEKAKQGDTSAFSEIYSEYVQKIYFLCLELLRNPQDAQDATQEIFLNAFQKIDTLENPMSFDRWIFLSATRKCINICKRKNPQLFSEFDDSQIANFSQDYDASASSIQEEQLIEKETADKLNKLIYSLPYKLRSAVVCYYFANMSVSEIAEAEDTSETVIKNRLFHARQKLKEMIESSNDEELNSTLPLIPLALNKCAEKTTVPKKILSATSVLSGTAKTGILSATVTKFTVVIASVILISSVAVGAFAVNNKSNKDNIKDKRIDAEPTQIITIETIINTTINTTAGTTINSTFNTTNNTITNITTNTTKNTPVEPANNTTTNITTNTTKNTPVESTIKPTKNTPVNTTVNPPKNTPVNTTTKPTVKPANDGSNNTSNNEPVSIPIITPIITPINTIIDEMIEPIINEVQDYTSKLYNCQYILYMEDEEVVMVWIYLDDGIEDEAAFNAEVEEEAKAKLINGEETTLDIYPEPSEPIPVSPDEQPATVPQPSPAGSPGSNAANLDYINTCKEIRESKLKQHYEDIISSLNIDPDSISSENLDLNGYILVEESVGNLKEIIKSNDVLSLQEYNKSQNN